MNATLATDWQARFEAGRTGWERNGLHPAFLRWRAEGTLAAGRILVPGAGRSREPAEMARAGFAVTAIDSAPIAIAFQRAALAGTAAVVEQADLLEWQPQAPFDAVYDQTFLCALPPSVWPSYAARLAAWLRPGGVLAVLFMQTHREGGPPFHCDIAQMRALFPPSAWQWPAEPAAPVAHPAGFVEQPAALRRRDGPATG